MIIHHNVGVTLPSSATKSVGNFLVRERLVHEAFVEAVARAHEQ